MKPSKEFQEVDRLTSAILDDTITHDDFLRLDDMLKHSTTNRRRYLEIIRLESILHWEADLRKDSEIPLKDKGKIISFPVYASLGSVAALLVALFSSWWLFETLNSNNYDNSEIPFLASQTTPGVTFVSTEPKNRLLHSSHNIPSAKILTNPHFSHPLDKVSTAINTLLAESHEDGLAFLEYHGPVKRWNRTPVISTPAQKGVLPASGKHMMALDSMEIDVDSQVAQVNETIQVLDIRDVMKSTFGKTAILSASVKFNQSFGEAQEEPEFGLTLSAVKHSGGSTTSLSEIGQSCIGDENPNTWNELVSSITLPGDTEFVVVSLKARRSGPDALLANTSTYFADDLEISLAVGDQLSIGPI